MGERTSYAPGTFSWVELLTTDTEAAKAFYGGLFGWEHRDDPAGETGVYTTFAIGDRPFAGMFELSEDMRARGVPPNWGSYVTVEDVDAMAARASELGGGGAGVVNEPGALSWNDLMTADGEVWRGSTPSSGTSRRFPEASSDERRDARDGGDVAGLERVLRRRGPRRDDRRARGAGGRVTVPPREVPAGRFAVVADPEGAIFSQFEGELGP
jgi:uncharacterized protein